MRTKLLHLVVILALALSLVPVSVQAQVATPVNFTILHTNDFHGQLEPPAATRAWPALPPSPMTSARLWAPPTSCW